MIILTMLLSKVVSNFILGYISIFPLIYITDLQLHVKTHVIIKNEYLYTVHQILYLIPPLISIFNCTLILIQLNV